MKRPASVGASTVSRLRDPYVLSLVVPAGSVIALAAADRSLPPLVIAALLGICAVSRPVIGGTVVLIAATDPMLFRDGLINSATAVDLMILAVVTRSALAANLRYPNWAEGCALCFLIVGGSATAFANTGSAWTGFLRVSSYLIFGLIVGRALRMRDRPTLGRAFIGVQVGQALAALAAITEATTTEFPFGRYLGTLGDPAQFGIPIAFAAVLVMASPNLIRSTPSRAAFVAVLLTAVVGSATRSAWAVAGVGIILVGARFLGHGRSVRARIGLALVVLTTVVLGTLVVVIGAGALGLNRESAELRRRSIEVAWKYLVAHPVDPLGLGNHPPAVGTETFARSVPRPISEPDTRSEARAVVNLLPDSSFEGEAVAAGWVPFRTARVRHNHVDAVLGQRSLAVRTGGASRGEGVSTSARVPGISGSSRYTFSIYAKLRSGTPVWLYRDEYDANGRWLTYGYLTVRGTGQWSRFSESWITSPDTHELHLYVLTAAQIRTAFTLDGAQLERGGIASSYVDSNRRPVLAPSVTYNTWLAVAVALGIPAAVLLFALAGGAGWRAYRLGDIALSFALTAMLVPSLSENLVYATSLVTLVWFMGLGLAASARS